MMTVVDYLRLEYQRLCEQHSAVALPDDAQLLAVCKTAHGHFPQWLETAFSTEVPTSITAQVDTDTVQAMGEGCDISDAITALMPWRKGPFNLLGYPIDSEWRSDFKYRRLLDLGFTAEGKHILDVGTGNGYFLYRLLGSGAQLVCGLDPSWHNFAQFLFLQRYLQQEHAIYIPATLESTEMKGFDTVMSMGVLYHRRDPLAFLTQLCDTVKSGGEIVIETLVVDGDEHTVYMPEERYAGMRNVWFLPAIASLEKWLKRLGLKVVAVSDAVLTTSDEQRRTQHIQSHSLAEFMQEHGDQPPPKRAIVMAEKIS